MTYTNMRMVPAKAVNNGEGGTVMDTDGDAKRKAQVVYFSHGGGPLPILGDPRHKAMIHFMRQLPARLRRPDAILVISAHWEEEIVTLQGADSPSMFYDYYGFPEEAYEITYPAPGNPAPAPPGTAGSPAPKSSASRAW